jgi:hypothetical protein
MFLGFKYKQGVCIVKRPLDPWCAYFFSCASGPSGTKKYGSAFGRQVRGGGGTETHKFNLYLMYS